MLICFIIELDLIIFGVPTFLLLPHVHNILFSMPFRFSRWDSESIRRGRVTQEGFILRSYFTTIWFLTFCSLLSFAPYACFFLLSSSDLVNLQYHLIALIFFSFVSKQDLALDLSKYVVADVHIVSLLSQVFTLYGHNLKYLPSCY